MTPVFARADRESVTVPCWRTLRSFFLCGVFGAFSCIVRICSSMIGPGEVIGGEVSLSSLRRLRFKEGRPSGLSIVAAYF